MIQENNFLGPRQKTAAEYVPLDPLSLLVLKYNPPHNVLKINYQDIPVRIEPLWILAVADAALTTPSTTYLPPEPLGI